MARYFIRFRDAKDRKEAISILMEEAEFRTPKVPLACKDADRILITDLSEEERVKAEQSGAEVFEDKQFYHADSILQVIPEKLRYWDQGASVQTEMSVRDVMKHNRAVDAWANATGKGVTIGIIDSGIAGCMREFPPNRQSPHSKSFLFASEWVDAKGHGSMCACAAGASNRAGGKYNGVAPECQLMSMRSSLSACDIFLLYDWVIYKKRAGEIPGPVVLSNSYSCYTCNPISIPFYHPYVEIIQLAVDEGIPVIFAAGNNHYFRCGHEFDACSPNTIWGLNSLDDVFCVSAVNQEGSMLTGQHANSSRGPGQWSVQYPKPDCVAPSYGWTVWGAGYRPMEWWGTSGACPQVAGLAALILEKAPTLQPHEVYELIRNTCQDLGLEQTCQGAGLIDCEKAVKSV